MNASAILVLQELSVLLQKHQIFRRDDPKDIISSCPNISEITDPYTQILGKHIVHVYHELQGADYVVEYNDVVEYIGNFIEFTINYSCIELDLSTIEVMLNNYPIVLVSSICNIEFINSFLICEAVRYIIEEETELPLVLLNIASSDIPLTGQHNSPLSILELRALQQYLGSKQQRYIHILLQAVHEFKQYNLLLPRTDISFDDIVTICNSAWFYLFSLYITRE